MKLSNKYSDWETEAIEKELLFTDKQANNMGFNSSALRDKLEFQACLLRSELLRRKEKDLELEPVVRVGQILGSRAKAESQYDNYRFSKDNPNPNWS